MERTTLHHMLFRKITYLFIVFIFLTDCQVNKKNVITGVWVADYYPKIKLEFTKDGYFYEYDKNGKIEEILQLEEQDNGSYEEFDYGKLIYNTTIISDSIFIDLVGENNDKLYSSRLYFIDDNCLTEVLYKVGLGINNHIQKVSTYFKEGTKREYPSSKPSFTFILPKGFGENDIYIAFGQKNGQILREENSGIREVIVPRSGILKLQEIENVRSFAWGNINFVYEGMNNKEIDVFKNKDVQKLLAESMIFDQKISVNSHLDSVVVFAGSRFNPRRDFINEIFQEKIIGNTIHFEVVELKSKLKRFGIGLDRIKYENNK